MNESQYVYVVEYGEKGYRFGVTESMLLSAVKYLKHIHDQSIKLKGHAYRAISITWTELTDDLRNRMEILDESSFMYKVSAKDPETQDRISLLSDIETVDHLWRSLTAAGYQEITQEWCCPVIDHFRNIDKWQMVMNYSNYKVIDDIEEINNMCDELQKLDPAQGPLVSMIRSVNTPDGLDESTAENLIQVLNGVLSHYKDMKG